MKHDFSKMSLEELAVLVHEQLKKNGIEATLVGGACVSIYSQNKYQSYDLDFVTYDDIDKVEEALIVLGFKKKGRYFSHPDCPYLVDFVNPPIAIGKQPIKNYNKLVTQLGELQLLTPTDCVKDRLASYYYWRDYQGLDQAILVANDCEVDLEEILRWSQEEGQEKKYEEFKSKLRS